MSFANDGVSKVSRGPKGGAHLTRGTEVYAQDCAGELEVGRSCLSYVTIREPAFRSRSQSVCARARPASFLPFGDSVIFLCSAPPLPQSFFSRGAETRHKLLKESSFYLSSRPVLRLRQSRNCAPSTPFLRQMRLSSPVLCSDFVAREL